MTESTSPDVPPPIPAADRADRKARALAVVSVAAAILVLGALVCIRLWVLTPFSMPTRSMYPTVKPGSVVFIYKLAYASASDVRRGDLVAYRTNTMLDGSGDDTVFLKRVIGIPGDRISTNSSEIILNGGHVPQKYLREDGAALSLFEEKLDGRQYVIAVGQSQDTARAKYFSITITIPAGCFFVVGDNRTNSLDSRQAGFVRFSNIVGRKL